MGRHRGDADGPPPRIAERTRRAVAVGLLWAGRALLIAGPIWIAVAVTSVRDEDLAAVTFLVAAVLVIAAPLMVLPVASLGLVQQGEDTISAPTVLGRRVLRRAGLRVRAPMVIPGQGPSTAVLSMRDLDGGWLVVLSSESWDGGWSGRALDAETDDRRDRPRLRQVRRLALGWAVMLALCVAAVGAGVGAFAVVSGS